MADSKITALTAISTVDPTADPLVIVDVSDTSMAASGTTKKSTINQLLGSGGTATLASATITGDLTVRTSKLAVTSTGVGVNYTTPAVALHVGTTGATNKFCINTAVTNAGDIQLRRGAFIGFSNAADNTNSEYLFANGGALEMGIAGTTAMTLNSTGLTIGGSAIGKLTAYSTTNGDVLAAFRCTGTGTQRALYISADNSTGVVNLDVTGGAAGILQFKAGGTNTMQIDATGNLILQSSATPATLTTNGQLTVNATSNTNLRFSYRGSDGVTRVANITLA